MNKLQTAVLHYNEAIESINQSKSNAYQELYKTFERHIQPKSKLVQELVSKLEGSKNITAVPNDEWYHQWIRIDVSTLINKLEEMEVTLLTNYLSSNYNVHLDTDNEVLTMSIGPAILILKGYNQRTVVDQDSNKAIIPNYEGMSTQEMYAKIEQYMEKTGHFPSVLSVDGHGNAFYVNTQDKE